MAAISTMRSGVAAPRASVARAQTVKVVARGSWRDSATVTASPQASGRASSAANRKSPTRSVLPANWRQELESLRNGSGSSSSSSAPAPAPRSSSASWRDAPASSSSSSSSAPRSSSAKKPVTPTRSSLPANWKQELESLRGSSGNSSTSSYDAPAPARSTSASWRDAPSSSSSSAPRSSSAKKPVTPARSSLPANWKQELESLRGSSGNSSTSSYDAPARSSSSSWRDAPAASAPRPSSPRNKTVTPSRSSLPANWKQELEALRGSSGSNNSSYDAPARSSSASWRDAPAAPAAPARSSSSSWRDAPAAPAKSASPSKQGTNPWTGKGKVEIKRTTLPADWRKGL